MLPLATSSMIPRSHTYPTLKPPGSPKESLQAWLRRRPSWSSAGGGGSGGSAWRRPWASGKAVAVTLALLYGFLLLSVPLLYVGSSRVLHRGGFSAASSPDELTLGSGSSAAAQPQAPALHRRMAMQRAGAAAAASQLAPDHQAAADKDKKAQAAQAAAAAAAAAAASAGLASRQLWPDTGLAALNYGAKTAGLPRVEYRDAGHVVLLQDALNASFWGEEPLYQASPVPHPVALSSRPADAASAASGSRFPPWCPQTDIRAFVGITSRCCTPEAQAKRAALRKTWVAHAREHYPGMVLRFILAQPVDESEVAAAASLLRSEIQQHADIIIVPGQELYRYLPNKTLQLLRYALSSDCKFTHVMKTDDDVYIRPQRLMEIITTGHYNFSMPVQYDGSGRFDGTEPSYFQAPWMSGMYVGAIDSNKSGIYPGWKPNRQPDNKWYLSEADLPDELAPLGMRWVSGWGYLLSRDLAEYITNTALLYAAMPEKKPAWWGRMPWEDIMIGAMLADVAKVHHHSGFKAAWNECDPGTVLKHLDNDAPSLQEGLHAQELNGLWARKSIVCSSGAFEANNYGQWRVWRNSLADNQIGGFM